MRHLYKATVLFFALPSVALASTFHGSISIDIVPSLPAIVMAAPSANPGAGTYTSAQSVTLSAEGSNNIRYTTDGSTPSCNGEGSGTVFSSPIDVSSSLTIQAISCYSGGDSSAVVSFAYVISIPAPAPQGGGGGNGPIAGSLPLPVNSGGGGGGTTNTESTPPANTTPQVSVVVDDASPAPDSGGGTGDGIVAGASTSTVSEVPEAADTSVTSTSSQVAAAASSVGGGWPDYWWMLLLLLLFLLGDAWWVQNSRKFKQRA